MTPRVSRRVEIDLMGTTILVGELIDILEEFPRESMINVEYYRNISNDPRESDNATLRIVGPKLGL